MQAVERALFAVEKTHKMGRMTVALLSRAPGWDKASASRYLSFLSRVGWLEKVNASGHPVYVLGRKVLDLAPDLRGL
jgi:DNA-binding IclR family transcriptional regulator